MAGQIKVNAVQLGDSTTDTQNFILKTNIDGTGKLSRGNAGNLGDVLAWDANSKLTLAAVPAVPAQSMIRLGLANGYGSTNTMIRRLTNLLSTQGTDITYADSATLGASFTINVAGVYAISYTDQFSVSAYLGLSLNTTQPTAGINSLSAPEMISINYVTTVSGAGLAFASMYFPVGSVIRPHTNGMATSAANPQQCQLTITRVS